MGGACGGRRAWKSPVVPSETLYNLRAPAMLPEPDGMPRQSRYARVTVIDDYGFISGARPRDREAVR